MTQHEYCLKDTETIVSKTDLQGNITYVNQDFIRISGYSADELMGAPRTSCATPTCPKKRFTICGTPCKAARPGPGL
ncbi:PAS domain S-box protein [Neopusillimonas aromaticivorans]|uniref:PAS domain S-box protein n=1 Tax=Neopusillimonas aromaticivorans TaxID=2979868 RepID=UPI002595254D|nr:PAS domain S-box protein [Neopusillimonas aromaticivorans]WJJ93021.1 PAS domain S-box protein [Neopusillimonas aromaticivorans]